jgi:hypothetical protein
VQDHRAHGARDIGACGVSAAAINC